MKHSIWTYISTVNILIELLLVLIPVFIIGNLQLALNRKFKILVTFSLRIL